MAGKEMRDYLEALGSASDPAPQGDLATDPGSVVAFLRAIAEILVNDGNFDTIMVRTPEKQGMNVWPDALDPASYLALNYLTGTFQYLFNGVTWDRTRTPSVFKPFSIASASGDTAALWTPAAGKRVRLMGWSFYTDALSVDKIMAGAGEIFRVKAAIGQNTLALPGNGILCAVDAAIKINRGTASAVDGTLWGCEE